MPAGDAEALRVAKADLRFRRRWWVAMCEIARTRTPVISHLTVVASGAVCATFGAGIAYGVAKTVG